jgi:hypothetical protein
METQQDREHQKKSSLHCYCCHVDGSKCSISLRVSWSNAGSSRASSGVARRAFGGDGGVLFRR